GAGVSTSSQRRVAKYSRRNAADGKRSLKPSNKLRESNMRDHRNWKEIGWAVGICAITTAMWIVPALAQDVSALTSPNPATRAAAACELGRNGARGAIPQLIALLEDGTPLPRQIFCGTQPP